MDDDASADQNHPIIQTIRAHPAGITDDDIRAQLTPQPSDSTLHRHLGKLEQQGLIEHFPDPADRRKVLYRTRDARVSPPAEEKRSPFTVHGSPIPPNPNHPETAAESRDGAEPSQDERSDVPDTGALQAQAFAELQARAVREVVRDVILHLVPPQGVAGMARAQAAILHWNTAETAALIAKVRQVLPTVTPENASAYDLLPEDVTAWSASTGADANFKSQISDFKSAESGSGDRPDRHPPGTGKESQKAQSGTPKTRSSGHVSSEVVPDVPVGLDQGDEASAMGTSRSTPNPQSSKWLMAAVDALIERYAPDLPPAFRPLVAVAALGLMGGILALATTNLNALVSSRPKTALLVAVGLVVVGYMALNRRARKSREAVVAAVGDRGGSDPAPGSVAVGDRAYNTRPRRGWFTTLAAFVLVAAIAAGVWYWRRPSRPSDAAIAAYLTQAAAPLPVHVVSVAPSYTAVSSVSCTFTYQAVLETTAPLYRRLDAAEYLKSQISNFKSTSATPVLVTTATPPGSTAIATGMILAWRRDGAWVFSSQQGGFDHSRFVGEPKPAGARVVDDPADVAWLNAWLAEQVAYAAKVQTAAAAAAAERERNRQQQSATFARLLGTGTLFVGTLTDPVRGVPQRVVLEITSSSATTQQLSVALRNDGGWTDARPFTGTWALNAAADAAVITLKTSTRDYIDSAGPLLQDRLDLSFALQVAADGSAVAAAGGAATDLKSQISNFKSAPSAPTLRRIDPADAAAVRDEILRPIAPAIAATQPGKLYRGTATSRTAHTTEPLLLRFGADVGRDLPIPPNSGSQTRRDQEIPPYIDLGKPIELRATFESTTVAGAVRPLRGTIVSNTYRVANAPIQLVTEDRDRVARGGANSALSFATGNGFKPALRVEGERILGEDRYFTYEFAPEVGNSEERQTGNVENPGAPNPPATTPIENRESKIENPLPPFPAAAGAYLLVDGRWAALPRNNGNVVKSFVQKANGVFGTLNRIEDKLAGKASAPSTDVVGDLIFSGRDAVPAAAAGELVIAYVGPLALNPKFVAQYPAAQLEDVFSVMELAPLKPMSNGNRYTPMSAVFGELNDFGPRRLPATVAAAAPNVTLLRCTARLPAGGYALDCIREYYELAVK